MADLNYVGENTISSQENSCFVASQIQMNQIESHQSSKIQTNPYKPIQNRYEEPRKRKSAKCILCILIPAILILLYIGFFVVKATGQKQHDVTTQPAIEKIYNHQKVANYQKSSLQTLSIPNFDCKPSYFANWDQSKAQNYVMKDKYMVTKLPYPQLVLVQDKNLESPTYHYPDLVAYLKEFPASKSIYIHSAPVYSVLLAGAVSPDSVSIIVGESCPEKYILKTNFVMNNIKDKLVLEQQGGTMANINSASYVVTTSPDFAKLHIGVKKVILIAEKEEQNPNSELMSKMTQQSSCIPVQLTPYSQQMLDRGIYVNHTQT